MKAKGLVLLLAAAAAQPAAMAEIVTFRASGHVNEFRDTAGLIPFSLVFGQTMSVEFVVDTNGTKQTSSVGVGVPPYAAQYISSILSGTVTIGTNVISIQPSEPAGGVVEVTNDRFAAFPGGYNYRDELRYSATNLSNTATFQPSIRADFWTDSVAPGNLINSLDLITIPTMFESFQIRQMNFTIAGSGNFSYVSGVVESVAPVPLPAAAWLLLSGVGALASFARRRRLLEA